MALTALIAGSTGLVGRYLVRMLAASPDFSKVTALARNRHSFKEKGVDVVEIDFDRLEDFDKYLKADVVFCCLGTTIKKAGSKEQFRKVDYDYPLALAKITKNVGARQFNIITSMGADPKSMFFYNRVKGEVEEGLKELGYEILNIYRPSLLLGDREEHRAGEKAGEMMFKILNPLLIGPLKKYKPIHAEVVARAMLRKSLESHEKTAIISSDILQRLGGVL